MHLQISRKSPFFPELLIHLLVVLFHHADSHGGLRAAGRLLQQPSSSSSRPLSLAAAVVNHEIVQHIVKHKLHHVKSVSVQDSSELAGSVNFKCGQILCRNFLSRVMWLILMASPDERLRMGFHLKTRAKASLERLPLWSISKARQKRF